MLALTLVALTANLTPISLLRGYRLALPLLDADGRAELARARPQGALRFRIASGQSAVLFYTPGGCGDRLLVKLASRETHPIFWQACRDACAADAREHYACFPPADAERYFA